MKNYAIKFKHIFPSFIVLTLSTILGMTLLRWLTTIQFDQVHFKLEIWNLFLPIAISGITVFIFLKPKLKLLSFKDDDEQNRSIFIGIALVTVMIPTTMLQEYLSTSFSSLTIVENIDEIEESNSRFYRIKNYEVSPTFDTFVDRFETGQRFNKKLTLTAYFVFPMTTGNEPTKIHEYKYWYGLKFEKKISYTLSAEEIDKQEKALVKKYQSELRWADFKNANYYERLTDSFERDRFVSALPARLGSQALDKIILIPKNGPLPLHDHEQLIWASLAYCFGAGVFFLLLDWPGYNTIELERIEKEKVQKR
jgi:rhomboid protease GluP